MALQFIRAWLAANKTKAREVTPNALWFAGLALIALGIGMVALPAGVIAAGLGLCFIGYAAGEDQ